MMNSSILQLYGSSQSSLTTPQPTSTVSMVTTAIHPTASPILPQHSNMAHESQLFQEETGNGLGATKVEEIATVGNSVDTQMAENKTAQVQEKRTTKLSLGGEGTEARRDGKMELGKGSRPKRSHRTTEEEGVADEGKPRRKRVKAKGERSERGVASVTKGELEGRNRPGSYRVSNGWV